MIERIDNTCLIYFDDESYKEGIENVFDVVDGKTPFYISNTWSYQDKMTLRSGKISHRGVSETTFNIIFKETGSIKLNCAISSEQNYDKLHVFIDEKEVITISGTQDLKDYEFEVTAGSHSLRLRYDKDGSGDRGHDACAIGYILLTGVEPPYLKKHLLVDFADKVYTITDGSIKELSNVTKDMLNLKSTYDLYGFEELPTSAQFLSLTKPILYRWSDGDIKPLNTSIKATPKPQIIKGIANMSHPTIKGIQSITAIYSGEIKISYSYDDKTYTDPISLAEFLNIDVVSLYEGATNKIIYFKLTLVDENSSITNFIITYIN